MLIRHNILGNPMTAQPRRDQRFLCFVMDQLALAVHHGLPIPPVLGALRRDPVLAGTTVSAALWRNRLAMVCGDLEAGRPLSEAFHRRFGSVLPAHFVPALREAESRDCVAETLPLLAENLSSSLLTGQRFRAILAYPLVQAIVVLTVVSGLFVFIVPKFAKMFDEMLAGEPMPQSMQILIHLSHPLRWVLWLIPLVVLWMAVFWGVRCILRRSREGRRFLQAVMRPFPILNGMSKAMGLSQMGSALAGFLAAGQDVPQAAATAAETVESGWAARKLRTYSQALQNGTPAGEAWEALCVTDRLGTWMVHNAVSRERPGEGFQAVAEQARDDLIRRQRRLQRWLEPIMLITNGFAIGFVCYALYSSLSAILYGTLEFVSQ